MIPEKKKSVIIVAGGRGLRVGGEVPKQFQLIGGKPMLMRTISAFYDADYRTRIVVVLPEEAFSYWEQLCEQYHFAIDHLVVKGGETRFHSVRNGLEKIAEDETVAIHDAARPFVSSGLIKRCFDISFEYQCGVIPVVDEVNSVRILTETGSRILDRTLLKIVQTPQVFPASLLKPAYTMPFDSSFTDDASVAEKWGVPIRLEEGESINIKITTSFEMTIADYYYEMMANR